MSIENKYNNLTPEARERVDMLHRQPTWINNIKSLDAWEKLSPIERAVADTIIKQNKERSWPSTSSASRS